MKGIVKITLAFVLGIIVTTTIILPKMNQQAETAETPPTQSLETQIQAAVNEAVTLALAKSDESEEIAQIEIEPVSVPVEVTEAPAEVTAEVEIEVKAEPTPKPEKATVKAEQTPTPTVTPSPQVKKTEPEYFYEDGKKYTYINGFKCLITDEPDVQLDFYDWENDPLGKVQGPFTGNGN